MPSDTVTVVLTAVSALKRQSSSGAAADCFTFRRRFLLLYLGGRELRGRELRRREGVEEAVTGADIDNAVSCDGAARNRNDRPVCPYFFPR